MSQRILLRQFSYQHLDTILSIQNRMFLLLFQEEEDWLDGWKIAGKSDGVTIFFGRICFKFFSFCCCYKSWRRFSSSSSYWRTSFWLTGVMDHLSTGHNTMTILSFVLATHSGGYVEHNLVLR